MRIPLASAVLVSSMAVSTVSAQVPIGGEFLVNTATADGRFMVAWVQRQYGGFQPGVFARVYEADGSPVAGPFQVNASTTGRFFGVSAAADGPASFVVAWDEAPSFAEDPARYWEDVFARRFDTAGTPLIGPIQVNSETTRGHSSWPEVSSDGQGHFLVAWTRYAAGADVMARRFAPEVIFADRFEWGNLSAWSTSAGGADLLTSPEAAMGGSSLGLHGNVNDTQPLFVQDGSPRGEHRYRARFYFDLGDFDPGEAQGHFRTRLFIGFEEEPEQRRLFAVVLRRRSGEYALMARARGDDNAQLDTGFVPSTPGPHAVEIAWTRSSGVDTGDGSLELWVDGTLAGSVAALDNDRSVLDFVRLGALSLKAGASGTLSWDEFESRRASAVGP